jgi:hypothetical protein
MLLAHPADEAGPGPFSWDGFLALAGEGEWARRMAGLATRWN